MNLNKNFGYVTVDYWKLLTPNAARMTLVGDKEP